MLLELAPCGFPPVAGHHRASPSAALDKVFSSGVSIHVFAGFVKGKMDRTVRKNAQWAKILENG